MVQLKTLPQTSSTKDCLYLVEIFASVQGETSLTGLPTTFIRLSACNLRCSWCDTTYSFKRGLPYQLDDIIAQIKNNNCPYVCVTGGEPLLQQNVYALISRLCNEKFIVSVETGGSLSTIHIDPRAITILDIKCPGSLMSHKNYFQNLYQLRPQDEVKFVLLDRADYDYAKEICHRYSLFKRQKEVLFSPVHGKIDPKELIKWILEDQLPVRLNLQLHKYIWDPLTKGV